jgi:hypothetical protein
MRRKQRTRSDSGGEDGTMSKGARRGAVTAGKPRSATTGEPAVPTAFGGANSHEIDVATTLNAHGGGGPYGF